MTKRKVKEGIKVHYYDIKNNKITTALERLQTLSFSYAIKTEVIEITDRGSCCNNNNPIELDAKYQGYAMLKRIQEEMRHLHFSPEGECDNKHSKVLNFYVKDFRLLQKCKKCEEKSSLLLQKKDPFCKSCFFEYCSHKFRSTIGKSKKIKHGDKVLLACSAGRKSAALLHMTKQTLKSASLKQISFTPGILFVDDIFIASDLNNGLQPDMNSVIKQLEKSEYPVLFTSLEKVYKINTEEILYFRMSHGSSFANSFSDNELKLNMKENFKNMPLSAKIDLLKHLRLLLITEIAKQAGYDFVFVGDTASSLAIELLSDIALGRGSQIFSDTSFYDTRYKVPICRPLREFLNKELSLYNHLHSVTYEIFPDFLTKSPPNSCIQRLTETFLSNLQENFPATIFTVFRTGSKLSKSAVTLDKQNCIICMSPVDNKTSDHCSALEALKISEKLSVHSSHFSAENDTIKNIMEFLCHGCSITFKHMSKTEDFHSLIPESTSKRMERNEMKEEIKDFLLEDDDS